MLMRPTLQLVDDVLAAARVLARRRRLSVGAVSASWRAKPCADLPGLSRRRLSDPDYPSCP